jgi:hypothetical protein
VVPKWSQAPLHSASSECRGHRASFEISASRKRMWMIEAVSRLDDREPEACTPSRMQCADSGHCVGCDRLLKLFVARNGELLMLGSLEDAAGSACSIVQICSPRLTPTGTGRIITDRRGLDMSFGAPGHRFREEEYHHEPEPEHE